jgi:hypothetical protein
VDIKDSCLVNLVSGGYKIISKVLVNRLEVVLEKVISRSHNAFIKERHILDSVFIANKCLNSRVRLGALGVL